MDQVQSGENWLVREGALSESELNVQETLFAVGNGYQGTRGTFAEGFAGDLSGTYLAGVYDDHDCIVIDQVNAPSWLPLAVRVEGQRIDGRNCRVITHNRVLDLQTGLLHRDTLFEDPAGRRTRIKTIRLCSMADQHICGIQAEITAENHSAAITVEAGIDGDRRNLEAMPAYQDQREFQGEVRWDKWAKSLHLEPIGSRSDADYCYHECRTIGTGITIGCASRLRGPEGAGTATAVLEYRKAAQAIAFKAEQGRIYSFEKLVAIGTSRDGLGEDLHAALASAAETASLKGFDTCARESAAVWSAKWNDCDCVVEGDEEATRALRFNIYHLLIAANPNDPRANVGAKSMSGEGYRGHVFWDTEVFLLPFFIYTQPETAKALILYRYNTLAGAIRNAEANGYLGAQYAWESADTGDETTPKWTHDGLNRIWTGEEEIHITACVAFGIMTYLTATGDWEFMRRYGAEMLFQTSRFWVSRLEHNGDADRYELTRVIGPDEFHEHVDNNTFTNRMAQWHLVKAAEIFDRLWDEGGDDFTALLAQLDLAATEIENWRDIADKIYIPTDPDKNLVEQFEGYFGLEDLPITEWDDNHMPRYPEGQDHFSLNGTMLLKQPDVIMLMYMLPDEFSAAAKKTNFDFYEQRTLHKSSLSPAIHAIMGIETGDHSSAHRYFERSAFVDLRNNQGNTADGIHIASAGGTWQAAVCGFGGFRVRHGQMTFNPWLPDNWEALRFTLHWRGAKLHVRITGEECHFLLEDGEGAGTAIWVGDREVELLANNKLTVRLGSTPADVS